jgi:subtilisin-like proprotein convertase family protein
MAAISLAFAGVLAATLVFTASAGAATFAANGGSLGSIPDGTGDGSTCPDASSLDVTFTASGFDAGAPISSVGVDFTLGTPHPHVGDLRVELIAPGGAASRVIFSRTGATSAADPGDDSDLAGPYSFNDTGSATPGWWGAAAATNASTAVPTGTYPASTPGGSASGGQSVLITPSFSGVSNPNGTWTLRFSDCAVNNTGAVSAASLSVTVSPPSNDSFGNAVGLFGSAVTVNGHNRGATEEVGEPNYTTEDVSSTDPSVTRSVWYRWTAPGSGPASVDLCDSDTDFDTMLAVFTGTAVGSLTTVGTNNNSVDCPPGSFRSKVSFSAVQGTTYRILVDGCCGLPVGSFRLNLSGPAGPPLPFTPSGTAPKIPSNDFTFGAVKLDKEKGTATLTVGVPGAGTLTLGGKGVVKQRVAGGGVALGRAVSGAGKVKLRVKAKGAKKTKLNENGKVKVGAKVTFTPSGGTPASDTKKLTLKKDLSD